MSAGRCSGTARCTEHRRRVRSGCRGSRSADKKSGKARCTGSLRKIRKAPRGSRNTDRRSGTLRCTLCHWSRERFPEEQDPNMSIGAMRSTGHRRRVRSSSWGSSKVDRRGGTAWCVRHLQSQEGSCGSSSADRTSRTTGCTGRHQAEVRSGSRSSRSAGRNSENAMCIGRHRRVRRAPGRAGEPREQRDSEVRRASSESQERLPGQQDSR